MPDATIRIPLRGRDGAIRAYTLIDECDIHLTEHRWCMHVAGYAQRGVGPRKNRRVELLHRAIFGLQPGDKRQVDHINHDKLDNRRRNLRVVTYAENRQNVGGVVGKSQYRGVSWSTKERKWVATCKISGCCTRLGAFASELEAAHIARGFRLRHMPYTIESDLPALPFTAMQLPLDLG